MVCSYNRLKPARFSCEYLNSVRSFAKKKTDLIRDKAASQSCSQPWSLTLLIQLLEQGDHAGRRIASVVGRPQDLQPAGIFFMFCIFFILHIFTFFVIFLLIWLLLSLRSLQQTLAQRCPGHFIVHDELHNHVARPSKSHMRGLGSTRLPLTQGFQGNVRIRFPKLCLQSSTNFLSMLSPVVHLLSTPSL